VNITNLQYVRKYAHNTLTVVLFRV